MNTYNIFDFDNLVFDRANSFFSQLQNLKNYTFSDEKDFYSLELIIPGFSKKEIDISIHNDVLQVKANSKDSKGRAISFSKSFRTPKAGDVSEVKAVLENGILNLSIPKLKEAVPISIKIE